MNRRERRIQQAFDRHTKNMSIEDLTAMHVKQLEYWLVNPEEIRLQKDPAVLLAFLMEEIPTGEGSQPTALEQRMVELQTQLRTRLLS